MSSPWETVDEAATPITEEEREALIPAYITLKRELNEAEQTNIVEAERWAFSRKRDVLDIAFLKRLHHRMFDQVWRWAGEFRTSERNIGVAPYQIASDLALLLGDCRYWIEHDTYPADEIAARFHHRLVSIHPFPNGNGRHARLTADLLLRSLGCPRFTWGRKSLATQGDARKLTFALCNQRTDTTSSRCWSWFDPRTEDRRTRNSPRSARGRQLVRLLLKWCEHPEIYDVRGQGRRRTRPPHDWLRPLRQEGRALLRAYGVTADRKPEHQPFQCYGSL